MGMFRDHAILASEKLTGHASRISRSDEAAPYGGRGHIAKRHAFHWILLNLLLSFVFAMGLAAQSVNIGLTPHYWGLEDGLPDRVIQAIVQTPDGYLWLGTPHGLVRFDGFKFIPFGDEVAPTLREFGVSCILVANDGTLWLGSVGGGVTHLHEGHAAHFGTGEGFQTPTIRALYQSTDGTIWAGTDHGLYRLSGNRFSIVDKVDYEAVTTIVSDGAEGFWVAGVGLTHFQHGRFAQVPLPPLRSVIRSLAVSSTGELWIGALGALLQRRNDGSIIPAPHISADVRALRFDASGRLWIGTIGSGVLLRMRDGTVVREFEASDMTYKAVRAIVMVKSDDLWLGTHAGLIRMSHTGMDFLKVSNSGTSDFGSVFLDRDNAAWLSAGTVSRYKSGKEELVRFPELKDVPIRAVYREPSGAFWVGTVGSGAYRLVNGKTTAHVLDSIAISGFMGAPDGSTWIGSDHGLAMWSHGRLTHFWRSGDLTVGTVKAMALGKDGSVWLATPAGLLLFRNGSYLRTEVAERLAHSRIWSLCTGPGDALWIGAGTGLYLWRNGSLTHIALPKSLFPSQAVISICIDSKGRFLIAEPAVVFRISAADLMQFIQGNSTKIGNGTAEARLTSIAETFAAGSETGAELFSEIPGVASTDRIGGAWYATDHGLLHIGASSLSRSPSPPPVKIEGVVVDGAPVSVSGPIVLPPSTHNIQIHATPILLSGSSSLGLRARLMGFDDRWVDLLPGSSTSYGRLPPGRYTFRVEAYWPGSNAVSYTEQTVLQESAIYRRTWFIVLCTALAMLCGWLVYRARIHQMELRFQAVADERSRVAREIHDTLLQGCIGAVSLLEALEISQERARGNLHASQENRWLTIVQCVREQFAETIKEAREAIWNLRNTEDQKPLDVALSEALQRLTSRAGVKTSFRVDGQVVSLIPRVQHEMMMSSREAIINAISHAVPERIDLHLRFEADTVAVSIRDNGAGFKVSEVRFTESDHFGLSGMRERMRRVRGSVDISSKQGAGTTITLSLPLNDSRMRVKH